MKKLLVLIVILLFLLLVWFTKTRYNECCDGSKTVVEEVEKVVTPVAKKEGPLVYDWNSGKAITNDLWNAEKSKILSGASAGKILQVVGPYFKDEGEAVGLARAKAAAALFTDKMDVSKIELKAKLVDFYDDAKTSKFAHTDFNWLTRNENIQEVDNKVLIYFPTNSTKKLENANIQAYLVNVAKNLKGNNKKVSIVGHTDSKGSSASNYKLALGRANTIKSVLVKNGIAENRITASSKGEDVPISTNDTEEGRQKNRRVELEIK